jgi:hypothetical protein
VPALGLELSALVYGKNLEKKEVELHLLKYKKNVGQLLLVVDPTLTMIIGENKKLIICTNSLKWTLDVK